MDPLISLTIALLLAALFAASAAHQLHAWGEWPGIVRNYRLMPEALVPAVAAAVPLLETLTAAALLWPRTRAVGAIGTAVLLTLFALALGINIRRGRTHIDCGCLGSRLRTGLSSWMVLRNLVLAALSLALLVPAVPRTLSVLEIAVALINVLTLAILYPALSLVLDTRTGSPGASG